MLIRDFTPPALAPAEKIPTESYYVFFASGPQGSYQERGLVHYVILPMLYILNQRIRNSPEFLNTIGSEKNTEMIVL